MHRRSTVEYVDKARLDLTGAGLWWGDPAALATALRDPAQVNKTPWLEPVKVACSHGAYGIAFNPRDDSLAFVSFDGMLHIVDSDGAALSPEVKVGVSRPAFADVSFNVSGDRLALSTIDGTFQHIGPVYVIETSTYQILAKSDLEAFHVQFHPVLPYLFVGHFNSGSLRLVNSDTLALEQELLDKNGVPFKEMSPLRFNTTGCRVALKKSLRKLVIIHLDWRDMANCTLAASFVAEIAHSGFIWDAAFHPTQSTLLTAAGDRKIRLIDSTVGVVTQTLQFQCEVYSVTFDRSGRDVAVGLEDHSIRVLNFSTMKQIRRIDYGSTVRRVRYAHNGRLCASSGEFNQSLVESVRVFEAHGVSERVLHMTGADIGTVSTNTAGDLIAVLHNETAYIYASQSGDLIASAFVNSAGAGGKILRNRDQDLAFAPDGKHVAVTSMAGLVLMPLSGDARTLHPDTGPTYAVAYSPDGAFLAAINGQGELFLIDSSECLRTVTGLPAYYSLTPKDKPLACTNTTVAYCCHMEKKATVYLVDVDSAAVKGVLDADASIAVSVAFSAAGLLACTCTVATGGSKLVLFDGFKQTLHLHTKEMVWALAFRPNGQLVAGFASGIRFLDVSGHEFVEVKRELSSPVSHVACAAGVVAYATKTGDLCILSDQASPVYMIRALLDGQVSMGEVLSAHPDWTDRCLPTTFGCLTLLHCAVTLNRREWITELLLRGAHPLIEAEGGVTSIDVALHFCQRNSLEDLVVALGDLISTDCGALPISFARTLAELITAGVPCTNLIKTRLPPSHDPLPDRAFMPTKRRTTCGDSIALVDHSVIASTEAEALVPIRLEVCRIPGLFTKEAGLLRALYFSPREDILEDETIEALLYHMWYTYGFKLHMVVAALVLIALIAFIIDSFNMSLLYAFVLLISALIRVGIHLRQMTILGRLFWRSSFHKLAICVVGIQLTLASCRLGGLSIWEEVVAIAALLIWLDFIAHLRAFESTAAILTQTKEICHDMLPFLFVLALVVVMYGHAVVILSPEKFIMDEIFDRYSAMIGGEKSVWSAGDDSIGHQYARVFLSITCSIFGTVVMLNMLIALLCDTFERTQQNVVALRNRELAGLILDMECLMRLPPMGAFFFVCWQIMYEEKKWTGLVGELKVHLTDSLQNVKDQITDTSKHLEATDRKLELVDQKLEALSNSISSVIADKRQSHLVV